MIVSPLGDHGGEHGAQVHERRSTISFYTTVADQPGKAYKLLETLADLGINLLAFAAVPIGPLRTQLTLFPEDSGKLAGEARSASLVLDDPIPR